MSLLEIIVKEDIISMSNNLEKFGNKLLPKTKFKLYLEKGLEITAQVKNCLYRDRFLSVTTNNGTEFILQKQDNKQIYWVTSDGYRIKLLGIEILKTT